MYKFPFFTFYSLLLLSIYLKIVSIHVIVHASLMISSNLSLYNNYNNIIYAYNYYHRRTIHGCVYTLSHSGTPWALVGHKGGDDKHARDTVFLNDYADRQWEVSVHNAMIGTLSACISFDVQLIGEWK